MQPADPPYDEAARQRELDRLRVLDTIEERAYDDITRMAAHACGSPIALISLIDRDRQWFKSRIGLQARETPREQSFCAHAIRAPAQVFVVEDASLDPRFADNPLVTGDPHIRFYAAQMEQLRFLAQQVISLLEQRRSVDDAAP